MFNKAERLKKWSEIRVRGRERFVREYGMLVWGLPTAVFWSVGLAYREGLEQLPILLPVALAAFPLAGIWVGRLLWNANERMFAKASETSIA